MTSEPEVIQPQQQQSNGRTLVRGTAETESFGAIERRSSAELATAAAAAAARAEIESRYVMAMQRPRDMLRVRQRLIGECARQGFAETAIYAKPIGGGKKARGPSIRFAEAFMRYYGNIAATTTVTHEDDEQRTYRVTVTDYETNYSASKEFTLKKRVERSRPRAGLKVFGQRLNSEGNAVYIVEATEEDFRTKENAEISRITREVALRHLDGGLKEECEEAIRKTLAGDPKEPIEAKRRKMVDKFAEVSVTVEMLASYLGHPVDQTTPDEMQDLREIFATLKDGETSWRDIVDNRRAAAEEPKPVEVPIDQRTAELRAKAAAAKAAAQKPSLEEQLAASVKDPAALSAEDCEAELDDLRAQYLMRENIDKDQAAKQWGDALGPKPRNVDGWRDRVRRARKILGDALDAHKQ